MKSASVSARVRCKHCRAKVALTPARVKELSAKLALTLDCPACGKVFTTALLREPDAEPVAPPPPVPLPVPVPAAPPTPPVKPPFRPLLQADAVTMPPPAAPKQPHFAPLDDPYAAKAAPAPAGPKAGWWNGLSPAKQKLVLAGAVAVMALAIGVYKLRPKSPPPTAAPPAATQPAPEPGEGS